MFDFDVTALRDKISLVHVELKKYFIGQEELVELALASLFSSSHLLVQGPPGLGKTYFVNLLAGAFDLTFSRMQFTPDLLPADLIGHMVYSQKDESFRPRQGPIFTQFLLVDEINRASPKLASALLQAMAEQKVTLGDQVYTLDSPFAVMATMNPYDHEGTFSIADAQLDRFTASANLQYPSLENEKKILMLHQEKIPQFAQKIDLNDWFSVHQALTAIVIEESLLNKVVRLLHLTRPQEEICLKEFKGKSTFGLSTRTGLDLLKLAKWNAWLSGRNKVVVDDLLVMIPKVIGHRPLLRMFDEETKKSLLKKLVKDVF